MWHKENDYKVEYSCIDSSIQSCGIDGSLPEELERIAKEQGAKKTSMDGRVSPKEFYLRHRYQTVRDVFPLVYAPMKHIVMGKWFDIKSNCFAENP